MPTTEFLTETATDLKILTNSINSNPSTTTTDSKLTQTKSELPVTNTNRASGDSSDHIFNNAYFTSFIVVASVGGVIEILILLVIIIILAVLVYKKRRASKRAHLPLVSNTAHDIYNK